jgi:diacylglycerol kinase (ATP)
MTASGPARRPVPGAAPSGAPGRAASLARSFHYAFAGLFYVARTQRNFRIHLAAGTLASLLAGVLGLSAVEWAVLVLIMTMVLAAEMINTVVEAAVDLASPTYHPLAKVAKDVAAGTVLLTALGAVATGLFLFGPHLLALLARSGG